MSEHEELAEEIGAALDEISGFLAWTNQATLHLAAALVATGYRKPRTITTIEELDALPDGAVVVTCHGDASTIRRCLPDLAYHYKVKYGPATVLHEPEASNG